MISDQSYEHLIRFSWRFRTCGLALFGLAIAASIVLSATGQRVGIDMGGLPLVWALLGMQAFMGSTQLRAQARLQAKIDMLKMHKEQRASAGSGKQIYLMPGDTLNVKTSCGCEVHVLSHSVAHLEIDAA